MKKIALVVGLVLLVAACGDDAGDGTTTTAPGPQEPISVSIVLDDFLFDPATVTVRAGAVVDVTVDNVGGSDHNWTVLAGGETIVSVEAALGQTGTGSFTAPASGVYEVVCTIPGHIELGMEGTLVVEG